MNIFKIKYLLIIFPLLLSYNSDNIFKPTLAIDKGTISRNYVTPCPAETDHNRKTINAFVDAPEWQQGRQETNTEHLTKSQITLLQATEYTSACETFNERFHKAFTEEWPDGLPKNDVTYYKVGNFFFVIITPNQPDAPDEFVEGTTYITIFDQNL